MFSCDHWSSPLLVQIKSDKIFTGEVIYKLEGPGVDQEPKNFFEIDDKTGMIRSKRPLDREKHNSFTVRAHTGTGTNTITSQHDSSALAASNQTVLQRVRQGVTDTHCRSL